MRSLPLSKELLLYILVYINKSAGIIYE